MPTRNADVAQLVEHHLAKVRVAGSNPVVRSNRSPGERPFSGPLVASGLSALYRFALPFFVAAVVWGVDRAAGVV